jgi:ABC-2 type transport system ATP-binding protein
LLGPNGSGKTTLFRLLSTLVPVQAGRIEVAGIDVAADPLAVRGRIGIVFQSPSLDKKLTVDENIACQAALYGLSGEAFRSRRDEVLRQMKLTDRRGDFCEKLSGGLKRRVELAKGMLHSPTVMLLDEPSTGLDPSARLDLWQSLRGMADEGITVVLTTHLLEEAEKADRLAIMFEGRLIADGTPDSLRSELGDGLITVHAQDLDSIETILRDELGLETQRLSHQVRIRCEGAPAWVPRIADRLGDRVQSISVGRPGLEDVFIAKTGYHFD